MNNSSQQSEQSAHLTQSEQVVVFSDKSSIACDGGGGALGHPRVFIHVDNTGVNCPYCGIAYRLKTTT